MDTTARRTTEALSTPFDATLPAVPPKHERIHGMLKTFPTVVLVTHDAEGGIASSQLRARPMAVANLDDDCTLWFFSSIDSSKVTEARETKLTHVVCQSSLLYLSIEGRTTIVRDRKTIEAFWSKGVEAWFPEGKDDPRVCLLRFEPFQVEYWDSTGTRGLKYLFEAAKGLVTGEPPHADESQHATVSLTSSR